MATDGPTAISRVVVANVGLQAVARLIATAEIGRKGHSAASREGPAWVNSRSRPEGRCRDGTTEDRVDRGFWRTYIMQPPVWPACCGRARKLWRSMSDRVQ